MVDNFYMFGGVPIMFEKVFSSKLVSCVVMSLLHALR